MLIAVIVLSAWGIAEAMVIFALMNRVLTQAHVPPIELPTLPRREASETEPQPMPRRKLFSLQVPD